MRDKKIGVSSSKLVDSTKRGMLQIRIKLDTIKAINRTRERYKAYSNLFFSFFLFLADIFFLLHRDSSTPKFNRKIFQTEIHSNVLTPTIKIVIASIEFRIFVLNNKITKA